MPPLHLGQPRLQPLILHRLSRHLSRVMPLAPLLRPLSFSLPHHHRPHLLALLLTRLPPPFSPLLHNHPSLPGVPSALVQIVREFLPLPLLPVHRVALVVVVLLLFLPLLLLLLSLCLQKANLHLGLTARVLLLILRRRPLPLGQQVYPAPQCLSVVMCRIILPIFLLLLHPPPRLLYPYSLSHLPHLHQLQVFLHHRHRLLQV